MTLFPCLFAVLVTALSAAGVKETAAAPADKKIMTVTVDFPDDVSGPAYDHKKLAEMMRLIRGMGATRVHWLYYGQTDPADPLANTMWWWPIIKGGPKTIATLGEPLRAAVVAAHAEGLEIYGVLKPYNGGVAGSYPLGSPEANTTSRQQRIGGTIQQLLPFLERHPEMRMKRRPDPAIARLAGEPITALRVIKADNAPTRLRPEHLRIWVSADNYRYRPLDLVPKGKITEEKARSEVRDYRGNVVTRAGQPVTVITLEGLHLTEPFIVLTTTFSEGRGDFRNTALAMVEAVGAGEQRLPIVVATDGAWWIAPRDYRTYGLEFDSGFGPLSLTLDQAPGVSAAGGHGQSAMGGFIGLARGKNEYFSGTPSEAYPEVRQLWRGWVKAVLDTGVDGVDVRISAHGSLSDEPEEYGYNEPVLAEARRRYGDQFPLREMIAKIRGDSFSDFMREASRMTRERGKVFQMHFHAEAFRTDANFGQMNGIPSNIEFQWRRWLDEKLLDSIYLRTSWFEASEDPDDANAGIRSKLERNLADPVVVDMLSEAQKRSLPVILNRYIARAVKVDEYVKDFQLIMHDPRFHGFDVYEFGNIARSGEEGLILIQDRWKRMQEAGKMFR